MMEKSVKKGVTETLKELMLKRRGVRILSVLISGILMSLTVIFPRMGFLAFVGMIPAAVVLMQAARDRTVKLRAIYGYGFLYFMAFYSMGFHWFISMYPLSFIDGMSKLEAMAVVTVATFGLGAFQGLFSAFFGVTVAIAARGELCRRYPVLLPVTAGIAYPVFEWAQTLTWAGVPWSRLAAGQVEWAAMLKTVSLFGPYFLGAVIVMVNFLLAELILTDVKRRKRVCLAASALIVAVNSFVGAILLIAERDEGREVTVAAVQPNVSSLDPWGFNTVDETKDIVLQYANDASTYGATLIVLPETVFPINFYEGSSISNFSRALAYSCDATVVVGTFTEGDEGDKNSLVFISPDGEVNETVYSKRRLVPFGEFVPFRSLVDAVMPQLSDLLMLNSDLEASAVSGVADTEAGKIGGLICFDSIYESLTLESVRDGAELIVLSTNDSWFTGSRALGMHASQARLRAVETGRYLVRSASTGISMIISPDGRVLDEVPEQQGGYAIATVRLKNTATLYTVIGNTFSYVSVAFVLAVILSSVWIKIINKRNEKTAKN